MSDYAIADLKLADYGRKEIAQARRWLDPQPYEMPYEPVMPMAAYALAAARHMHQYGTTRRQLAEVAVAARAWGRLNPEAFMREPLSIDDVLNARMVADPLSVRDCCLVTDGGGAYVLVRADRAKDLARKPVYVLGNATAVWNRQISSMHDLTVTSASESGRRAFEMAGLAPKSSCSAILLRSISICGSRNWLRWRPATASCVTTLADMAARRRPLLLSRCASWPRMCASSSSTCRFPACISWACPWEA